jgi:predicted TIM-barrel fold metal-dependent hydrolase
MVFLERPRRWANVRAEGSSQGVQVNVPGAVLDADAHEMVPYHMWPDVFGEEGAAALAPILDQPGNLLEGNTILPDIKADDAEINEHNVWRLKGAGAPGAIDMDRRVDVLDFMGIDRQLLFPNFGLFGIWFLTASVDEFEKIWHVKVPSDFDMGTSARSIIKAHNDWVIREMQGTDARIRPVAVVPSGDISELMAEAERVLAGGALGLLIPSTLPPGGLSPADRQLDPFWKLAEDANVPVTTHVGADFGFMRTAVWGFIPEFVPTEEELHPYEAAAHTPASTIEFPGFDPYSGASFHYGSENFLQSIILGGVFERHPQLRFGTIENGACWVGPLAERLDLWSNAFAKRAAKTMSMKPSEYLARNVRVTPFHFEHIDMYFQRWPELQDVYCYSTDYPHVEGGKDTIRRAFELLEPLGSDVVTKYFLDNARWLLPEDK